MQNVYLKQFPFIVQTRGVVYILCANFAFYQLFMKYIAYIFICRKIDAKNNLQINEYETETFG